MKTTEIECRFLEIDKAKLVERLKNLQAIDLGEKMQEETIIYDQELKWRKDDKRIRVRKSGDKVTVCYKEHNQHTIDGTYEVEFEADSFEKAVLLFEKIGLRPYRQQQKYRHAFKLDEVSVDIDTWPKIPTYVELEGESEEDLREVAKKLDLDWNKVEFHPPGWIIENIYKIPVHTMRYFTFDKIE